MSEQGIITLIGLFLTAGVLTPVIGWVNRRLGGDDAQPAPVTTADADAVHAHQSQQVALASISALTAAQQGDQQQIKCLRADLGAERTARERLEGAVARLEAGRAEDARLIHTLTAWARDVVARWAVLRLSETPPPLPETIHPPVTPGDPS